MLSVAVVVLSVAALAVAHPLNPAYSGYNPTPQQPLYYYYYSPGPYPTSTYGQYPYGYAPGYTPGSYAPSLGSTGFTSGLTPASTTPGLYTFNTGNQDAPTTTSLPTLQAITDFLQNLISNLRPKPPTTTTGDTASDEASSSTTYYNPQTSTLYLRPSGTRYSYGYPSAGQQQTYGSASYYPYAGYNSAFYFPRYQNNQPLTTS